MLEKILVLLERFVAAHELLATASTNISIALRTSPVYKNEGGAVADVKESKPATSEAPAVEEKVEEEKAEEKPEPKTRRTRTTKVKEELAIDVKALRDEVLEIDDALTDGDIEEALDEFDDLMDEYKAKTLKDIKEADLPEFVKKARKIVDKYYDEK